jgi:tetratricopeptide (TPR) repeat protein
MAMCAPGAAFAQDGDGEAAEDAESMMTDDSAIDDQAAREYFNSGSSLYELGRYHDAAEQFQQAYDLSDRPALLYNLYLAHRDASEERPAAAALRLYLERMSEVENRQALTVRLENLENAIAEEDEARARAAQEGEESVRAEQEAQEAREAAEREAAESAGPSIVPWIITASGGAIVLAGVVTGIVALSLASGLEEDCREKIDGSYSCPPESEGQQSQLSTMATLTDVLLIGGGIIAAAGLTWAILQMSGGDDEEAPAVSAMCGPSGCAASVRGTF